MIIERVLTPMNRTIIFGTFKSILFIAIFCQSTLLTAANETDFLRSTGKIYVVIACIVVIFVFLFVAMFRMERKLKKMDKELDSYGS